MQKHYSLTDWENYKNKLDSPTKLKNELYKKKLSDIPFCKVISSRAALEPTPSRAEFRDPTGFHFGHDDYYRQIKSSVLILAAAGNGFIYKDLLSSLLHPPTYQPKHCKQLPEKQTSLDTPPILLSPPCWISWHEYFGSFRYQFLSRCSEMLLKSTGLFLQIFKQVQSI